MRWSHARDPERLARVQLLDPAGKLSVQWTAESGRARKKTINKLKTAMPLPNAWSGALKLLFSEGFLVRDPQDGPVQWMTVTREPFPQGQPFAVAPSGDAVWVADTGFVRRIERGTAHLTSHALGPGATPRLLAFDAQGRTHALVDLDGADQPNGDSPWRAPSQGGSQVAVVRIDPQGAHQPLLSHPWSRGIGRCLAFTRDGRLLAPHPEGAAIYDPDGQLLRTLPAQPCAHYAPKAAISPSGEHLVYLGSEGTLVLDSGGSTTRSPGPVQQVFELQVTDEGTVMLRGLAEHWGLFRWRPGGALEPLSRLVWGLPLGETIYALERDQLLRHPLGEPKVHGAPMHPIGMVRRGRLLPFPDGKLAFRTDTHTVGELDPDRA